MSRVGLVQRCIVAAMVCVLSLQSSGVALAHERSRAQTTATRVANSTTSQRVTTGAQPALPDPSRTRNGIPAPSPREAAVALLNESLAPSFFSRHPQINSRFDSALSLSAFGLQALSVQSPPPPISTGINRWWSYDEDGIPGIGRAMVNVGNGNLLVQADDVDIPERGIDLAFRRTYNSMSQHDSANTDGSTQGLFGNGWTNTFDAHAAYYNNGQTLSIYDIDGARYDYASNGSGGWNAPAGMQGTSIVTVSDGYEWHKKSGTYYYFDAPDYGTRFGAQLAGWDGRLRAIYARNRNNHVTFNYTWDNGDASTAAHINQITAVHANGQTLTLRFQDVDGCRELTGLQRPDGQVVNYHYSATVPGQLTEVDLPGNNVTTNTVPTPNQLPQEYFYTSSGLLHAAYGPRITLSAWATNNSPRDGSAKFFDYDANNRLVDMFDDGVVNFTPSDGTNSILQSGVGSGLTVWHKTTYAGYGSGTTAVTDTDGHSTKWVVDNLLRVTQRQEWSGSIWLTTSQTWGNNNNLTNTVDPRGAATGLPSKYETDYAYDASGNTTEVALPSESTSAGTIRPTSIYSYDANNNVTAYCDPVASNSRGLNWSANPGITSDSLCAATSGAARYTWGTSAANPLGFLTDLTLPGGYHTHWNYTITGEGGGDYSLPTSAAGDTFTQNGVSVTPTQSFAYDAKGNVICYSKLTDGGGTHWYRLSYDTENRATLVADPDDASTYMPVCANTAGIASSHIVTTTAYFPNGQVSSQQSPSQYAASVTTPYTYDADGNEITETHHFNGTAAQTQKWYDGADRLVEVELPADSSVDAGLAGYTRYIYDLSQNTSTLVVANSAAFAAHGNLYKTRECVPGGSPCIWTDIRGNAYDTLDRTTAKYQFAPANATIQKTTSNYDSSSTTTGLLASIVDPLSQTTSYTYDEGGHTTGIAFSGDGGVTPARTMTYDPDGHVKTIVSSKYGTQTYIYNTDGRLTESDEPTLGGVSSPSHIQYDYYANGWRQDVKLALAPSPLSGPQTLFSYTYRGDGLRASEKYVPANQTVTWSYTYAGRETSRTDPYTGKTMAGTMVAADARTYDLQGRVATHTFPNRGVQKSFTYDPEGEPTGYSITAPPYDAIGTVTSAQLGYTNRGELVAMLGQPNTSGSTREKIIRGYACKLRQPYNVTCDASVDTNVGAVTAIRTPITCGSNLAKTHLQTYTYDAGGRRTTFQDSDWDHELCSSIVDTTKYTYDAENHTLSQTCTGTNCLNNPVGCTTSVGWGPNGHAIQCGTYTLHWDGDQILFLTGSNGTLAEVKMDTTANVTFGGNFSGMTVYSRDSSESTSLSHNGMGFSIWNAGPQAFTAKGLELPGANYPASAGYGTTVAIADTPRTDGYNIYGLTFQGPRVYDAATQQWTTPDAYAGEVHDPMSQKPYMWNGNNPVVYQDPSGYESGEISTITGPVPQPTHDETQTFSALLDALSAHCRGECSVGPLPAPNLGALESGLEAVSKEFGPGLANNLRSVARTGGMRGLESSVKSFEKNIQTHQMKIEQFRDSGFVTSMQREVRIFQRAVKATKILIQHLKDNK